MSHSREDWIDGLRALADFIDQHPDVPFTTYSESNPIIVACDDDGIRAAAAAHGGWEKRYTEQQLDLLRDFGPVRVNLFCARRNVCTPRETKTTVVEVPDEEWIREQIKGIRDRAPLKTVEKTTVLSWDCAPLLGRPVPAEPVERDPELIEEPF